MPKWPTFSIHLTTIKLMKSKASGTQNKVGPKPTKPTPIRVENIATGEILNKFIGISAESTKDMGSLLVRVSYPQRGQILELYAKLRSEGTKDGAVLVRWDDRKGR